MTSSAPGATGRHEERSRPQRGQFSLRRKAEAALRLLRAEEIDARSRELGVTVAAQATWRDRPQRRPRDPVRGGCRAGDTGALARNGRGVRRLSAAA